MNFDSLFFKSTKSICAIMIFKRFSHSFFDKKKKKKIQLPTLSNATSFPQHHRSIVLHELAKECGIFSFLYILFVFFITLLVFLVYFVIFTLLYSFCFILYYFFLYLLLLFSIIFLFLFIFFYFFSTIWINLLLLYYFVLFVFFLYL